MNKVILTAGQATIISLFKLYQNHPLSTFDFRREGIASPSQDIARLKSKGAIIEASYQNAFCESGKLHKRVAHYSFNGWAN